MTPRLQQHFLAQGRLVRGTRLRILCHVRDHPGCSLRELVVLTGTRIRNVHGHLMALRRLGLVRGDRLDSGRMSPRSLYATCVFVPAERL